jgi:hypothetical protein
MLSRVSLVVLLHFLDQKLGIVSMPVFGFLCSVRHRNLTLSIMQSIEAGKIQVSNTSLYV